MDSMNDSDTDVQWAITTNVRNVIWPISLLGRKIYQVEYIIIFTIGFLGNIMSLIVSLRKRFRNQSSFRWVGALALVQLVHNFGGSFHQILNYSIDNYELNYITPFLCKARYYFLSTGPQIASWLLICMSVERLLCVFFPMKIGLFAMRFANIGIPTIFFIFIVSNSYNVLAYDYWDDKCQAAIDYVDLFRARQIIHATIYSYIPLCLLCLLNSMTIFKLNVDSSGFVVKKEDMAAKQRARRQRNATIMLVTVAVSFIFLTAPFSIVSIFYKEAQLNVEFSKSESFAFFDFMYYSVVIPLQNLNFSINFYLYYASGESFRDEVGRILRCDHSISTVSYVSNANKLKKAKKKNEMSNYVDDEV